jgi:hypothetical protein
MIFVPDSKSAYEIREKRNRGDENPKRRGRLSMNDDV